MDYYDKLESRIFIQIAELLKGSHQVLEIGCGEGKLSNFLAQTLKCRITAVDVDADCLKTGHTQSKRLRLSHLVDYKQWNGEELSFRVTCNYDACVSLYVLHELKHPVQVFREAFKILRNDGTIINADFPKGSIAEKLYEEHYYSPANMKALLTKTGFRDVEVRFTPCAQLAYVIGKKPNREIIKPNI